jgi:hypothetical protein
VVVGQNRSQNKLLVLKGRRWIENLPNYVLVAWGTLDLNVLVLNLVRYLMVNDGRGGTL